MNMTQARPAKMPKKVDRMQIPALGEWYQDLLAADARINDRSEPTQASSLLAAKLQEREARIKERVQYLADKRGISYQEMWKQLVTGLNYEKISPAEWAEMPEMIEDAENE
ncbi:hypothetical protein IFO70_33230 [Phormidium tenue FACHB-886]|nr:hypothetical protein [Phormidium tenue FACHB-886]